MLKIVDLALSNLELLGVEVAFATSPTVANELVTEMLVDAGEDGLIAVDLETAPLPEAVARLEAAANASTDKGFRSAVKRQLKEAGLHPHRAEVRVVQFYAGGRRVAVFDMRHIPWNVLDPIWSRPLVMHNAGFDLALLMRRGIVPTRSIAPSKPFDCCADTATPSSTRPQRTISGSPSTRLCRRATGRRRGSPTRSETTPLSTSWRPGVLPRKCSAAWAIAPKPTKFRWPR